jgi:hypothetical protein
MTGGILKKAGRVAWRVAVPLAIVYAVLTAGLAWTMRQPPRRVTRIMKHLPEALVFGVLPGPRLWMWARQGSLAPGDPAPDFTLPLHDRSGSVTLSSFQGRQPVVLVFGSYT